MRYCYCGDVDALKLCFHTGGGTLPSSGKHKPQQQTTPYGEAEEKTAKESRSQKHNRVSAPMLLSLKDFSFSKASLDVDIEAFFGNLHLSVFGLN